MLRRFVLLGVGLAFGLVAFETGPKLLHIVLENEVAIRTSRLKVMVRIASRGSPKSCGTWPISVSCSCWCWRKQADPLRASRLSLGAVIVCVFWAGLLCVIPNFSFPQPWGMMIAGTISLAGQCPAPGLIRNLAGCVPLASRPRIHKFQKGDRHVRLRAFDLDSHRWRLDCLEHSQPAAGARPDGSCRRRGWFPWKLVILVVLAVAAIRHFEGSHHEDSPAGRVSATDAAEAARPAYSPIHDGRFPELRKDDLRACAKPGTKQPAANRSRRWACVERVGPGSRRRLGRRPARRQTARFDRSSGTARRGTCRCCPHGGRSEGDCPPCGGRSEGDLCGDKSRCGPHLVWRPPHQGQHQQHAAPESRCGRAIRNGFRESRRKPRPAPRRNAGAK